MPDTLSKYIGRNDLKNAISLLQVVQGTAKESGNIYYAIELQFINGYSTRIFLKSDAKFAWVNAFEQLDTQKQIDAAL